VLHLNIGYRIRVVDTHNWPPHRFRSQERGRSFFSLMCHVFIVPYLTLEANSCNVQLDLSTLISFVKAIHFRILGPTYQVLPVL